MSIDRRAVARAFSGAASSYDQTANLQSATRQELIERLEFFGLQPTRILDVGAGTCRATSALKQQFPNAEILSVDLALGMLQAAPTEAARASSRICADSYRLPLADSSIDLVFSNLMLQWCDDLPAALMELARVMKPGAPLLFSTMGEGTLFELRSAWAAADAASHVSQFLGMPQLATALGISGLTEPVMDIDTLRHFHTDVMDLMRELKQLGATHASAQRRRGLTGRRLFERMRARYESYRLPQGLPATYEVIYGAAFRR